MSNYINEIIQGVIITLVGTAIIWFIAWVRFKKDESAILKFLNTSKGTTEYTFRGEPAISSETNLSEGRVHNVCSKSSKITRNKKDKKSWRLSS